MTGDGGLVEKAFDEARRAYKHELRKQRRRAALVIPAGWMWTAFCVAGAVGIVGDDHPWLVVFLGTTVWVLGLYLACRVWGSWL